MGGITNLESKLIPKQFSRVSIRKKMVFKNSSLESRSGQLRKKYHRNQVDDGRNTTAIRSTTEEALSKVAEEALIEADTKVEGILDEKLETRAGYESGSSD